MNTLYENNQNLGSKLPQAERVRSIEFLVNNMLPDKQIPLLIKGGTGIGKTTFVEQFARLFGLNLVKIEVPHVTEEKIINIPFIVFDKNTPKGRKQILKNPDIFMARSSLAAQLASLQKIPDNEYYKSIKLLNSHDKELLNAFLADNPNGRGQWDINYIRKKYHTILFLDEFLRQTNNHIRNILRGILDKQIGTDPIPSTVYTIYASNITDVGGSITPPNTSEEMAEIDWKPPSIDGLLGHIKSKLGDKL